MSPPEFVNLEELEGLAAAVLPQNAYDYFAAGAESGAALQRNTAAFSRYRILPRCLVDVSRVDTRVRMFGAPFLLHLCSSMAACVGAGSSSC
jgi:isopentenyl diphosphate isomerase/L-lactate dehydrogenase-like FMN-dependent dehydrogenase